MIINNIFISVWHCLCLRCCASNISDFFSLKLISFICFMLWSDVWQCVGGLCKPGMSECVSRRPREIWPAATVWPLCRVFRLLLTTSVNVQFCVVYWISDWYLHTRRHMCGDDICQMISNKYIIVSKLVMIIITTYYQPQWQCIQEQTQLHSSATSSHGRHGSAHVLEHICCCLEFTVT